MTDNGGGRDSDSGTSWFKPSEDRYLRQSDYQDPLEGQEQQETVFPDSGGYAGLSSSRPALADPYPEALGGPPAEAPNPLSYPGAGEAAYQPLTRIPGEDPDPRTQEIPALRPDSEPLWPDTAPPAGAERVPWEAAGKGTAVEDGGLRAPADPGYPDPAAGSSPDTADGGRAPWATDAEPIGDRGPAPDYDGDRGEETDTAGADEGRALWEPDTSWEAGRRGPDADLDGARAPQWDTEPRDGRAPWDADAFTDRGGPAATADDGAVPDWNTDPLRGDRGPRGVSGEPDGVRSPSWEGEDAGRGRETDPLADASYGSYGTGGQGSGWGAQADPLRGDPGTGWDDDPLGGEGRDTAEDATAGEDPWGWSGSTDGVSAPGEERASAPWTDVPEPDAWNEEGPAPTGNTWAFDRDDPRLPDVVREAERRRREENGVAEDPLMAIADMQSRARNGSEAEELPDPVAESPQEYEDDYGEQPEYEDGFTPADYGMPVEPKAKKRKKDPIAAEFPGFDDRPLGGEAGDAYPGYDSIDFLADTERGAVVTLWLGVASLIPGVGLVTALLALLVTGPRAKQAIRSSNGQLDGLGFITGGTVFAVLGILVTVISVALWLFL